MTSRGYQYADKRRILFDEKSRFEKAEKIYLVLREKYAQNLSAAVVLDIGCSTGLIDQWLADKVKFIYGIDIDEAAVASAREVERIKSNFRFVQAGGDNLPFENNHFDIVISNIMYNLLTPEAQKTMFEEIYRCLKPQGLCYFAAPNKLLLVHGKYKLPFLDFLPLRLARLYAKLFSPIKDVYNEYPKTIFGLRKMVHQRFVVQDITLEIIDNPRKYHFMNIQNKIVQCGISFIARIGYLLLPNYIFILYKGEGLR
jgi:SAM-dependent methyltransferase